MAVSIRLRREGTTKRPYYRIAVTDKRSPRDGRFIELIGTYDTTLTRHIWESMTASAQICLHVRVLGGRNAHHIVEAQFKAVARALREAVSIDPGETAVYVLQSTKSNVVRVPLSNGEVGAQLEFRPLFELFNIQTS